MKLTYFHRVCVCVTSLVWISPDYQFVITVQPSNTPSYPASCWLIKGNSSRSETVLFGRQRPFSAQGVKKQNKTKHWTSESRIWQSHVDVRLSNRQRLIIIAIIKLTGNRCLCQCQWMHTSLWTWWLSFKFVEQCQQPHIYIFYLEQSNHKRLRNNELNNIILFRIE